MAKYHGLGNDFLLLDGLASPFPLPLSASTVSAVCHRRLGVGADGLIVVLAGPPGADLAMALYNADGGRAQMSGNGIRCLAWFAVQAGLAPGPELIVATDTGVRALTVEPTARPGQAMVRVDMGRVEVAAGDDEVVVDDRVWRARAVDAGNPHLVLVEDDLEALDLDVLGPALAASCPDGVNVEWIRARPDGRGLSLRVWERGVGATLACGTGSAAAAAAAISMGLVKGPTVAVHNPGGVLELDCSGDTTVLTGPAQRVGTMEVDVQAP